MQKKELAKRYLIFLIGLYIMSYGISFITRASLGTSPISSIPYVLSLGFSPTLGQFTIAFNLLLITLQILLLGKRFKRINLLQIPLTVLFGYFIDWSMFLLSWMDPTSYLMKLLYLCIGCLILGFGVYLEVTADVIMLPGEAVVKAITIRFHTDFGITKVCSDASMAGASVLISLILFHHLEGVREGTILAAFSVGFIAKLLGKALAPAVKRLLPPAEEAEGKEEAHSSGGAGHILVTIGREFGSGGREIGRLVAEKLGITYYDSELIKLEAEESGYSEEYVQNNTDKLPNYRLYDLYSQYYSYGADEQPKYEALFTAEQKVMKRIAAQESCVIVGRASSYVFREYENALHVFISAGMEHKIRRVMHRDQMTEKEAERKIKKVDTERKNHCRYFTGNEWGMAYNYDLTLRTDVFSIEDAAQVIVQMARKKCESSQKSR